MAERIQRRLAALLGVDAAGMIEHMGSDPHAAREALGARLVFLRKLAADFDGRWVPAAGDDVLIEFPTAIEMVEYAFTLQRELLERAASTSPEPRIHFKLGAHLGDVLVEGERLHGDGVQTSLALMGRSRVGGLCASRAVVELVASRVSLELEEIGPLPIVGLPRPCHAFHVVTGGELEPPARRAPPDPERRALVAVLHADAVSYSRHMATDEASTVRAVTHHRDICLRRIERHRGRVVDSSGDAILAEFGSAVDAARAALAIQEDLGFHNAELGDERALYFRIGIHLADIRREGDRIYGTGVNVAARLEAMAPPGGICVSGAVFEQVQHHLRADFEDMGEQSLKNIPLPVRAYAMRGGGGQQNSPGA